MDLARRAAFVPDELEALLKFIPSPQLLKFRQVSKELDDVAQLVLRKRRDIKLILTTDTFNSKTNWKFLQFLNKSPENVFVSPVLQIQNANRSVQDLEEGSICVTFEIIGEICERLGNRGIIRKLIIEDGDNSPRFSPDFLLTLLGHFPSLETLGISELLISNGMTFEQNPKFQLPSLKQIKFDYDYFHKETDLTETANFLKMIMQSSPNLEKITGWDLHKLKTSSMLRDTGRLSKMKEITLRKHEDLDILLQCKPKLVLHSFTIHANAVDPKKLFMFLKQQAKSLKTFKFRCLYDSDLVPTSFTLQVLPVLEKLCFKSWRSDGCFLSVNYGRQTPALKTLKIFSKDNSHSWEKFLFYETSSEMPPCLSLEEMKLYVDSQNYPKVFDNWKNLFPNMKKLTITGSAFDFDQASKCWPKLEEFTCWIFASGTTQLKDRDLDNRVFGISRDWKRKIGKIDKTEENWWMKIPAPERSATVVNLKCLKKLTVKFEEFERPAILTDFAVYFGLRHMQNLEELEISSQEASMGSVSTQALDFLVKNLPKLGKLNLGKQEWKRGEILK